MRKEKDRRSMTTMIHLRRLKRGQLVSIKLTTSGKNARRKLEMFESKSSLSTRVDWSASFEFELVEQIQLEEKSPMQRERLYIVRR